MELLLQPPKPIEDRFRPDAEIVLFHGDVSEFLAQIPDRSVTLIITSPPYNLGKEYENRVAIEQYLQAQAEVIAQLYRVLREDGSICWQVGNFVEDGEVFPLDILYYPIFKALGLKLRRYSSSAPSGLLQWHAPVSSAGQARLSTNRPGESRPDP